jgi:V8-like Glu-specific endopeptidase
MKRPSLIVTALLMVAFLMAALTLLVDRPALADHESRELVPASALDERPWRGVVLITVARRQACTGFVIGRRKVATAAHCLTRDADDGDYRLVPGLPDDITLYRGYSALVGRLVHPACGVATVWAHPRFVRSGAGDTRVGSRAHDYAVLTTASGCRYPSGAVLRMRATSSLGGELPVGARLHLTGYPSDSRFARMDGLHLWRATGHAQPTVETARLALSGFVAAGMSGGPVFTRHAVDSPCGRRHCVVGILTECRVGSQGRCLIGSTAHRAIRITREVKRALTSH